MFGCTAGKAAQYEDRIMAESILTSFPVKIYRHIQLGVAFLKFFELFCSQNLAVIAFDSRSLLSSFDESRITRLFAT